MGYLAVVVKKEGQGRKREVYFLGDLTTAVQADAAAQSCRGRDPHTGALALALALVPVVAVADET